MSKKMNIARAMSKKMNSAVHNAEELELELESLGPLPAAGEGLSGDTTGGHAPPEFAASVDTLVVVATLITALAYQTGTSIPGGCWQDNEHGHVAGDPIMRDMQRARYWLFMTASWFGFGSSMLLTLGLLTGVPRESRFVLWAFVVAYSSIVLTFVSSQPHTVLAADLLVWAIAMAVLAVAIKCKRLDALPRCLR